MNPYQHGKGAQAAGPGPGRSGVHGMFRLDGGPVDPGDAARLGLGFEEESPSVLAATDLSEPWAASTLVEPNCTTCLAGWIDGQQELAARLGLRPDSSPALIARAALDRYGQETPLHLCGEWTLLRCDRRTGRIEVTAMSSIARRDPVFVARAGVRLAISSDLHALARLDWVDSAIDETGLLGGLGRAVLRDKVQRRTIYRGVEWLEPAHGLVFAGDGPALGLTCDPLALPGQWSGGPADACAEAEALLRQIMRERIARAGSAAVLLSGGLDSSLLAWAAAVECADARLLSLTSAAPPGCVVADEAAEARMVAESLGIGNLPITPGPELDSYRPSAKVLAGANGPPLGNRHCLTETFQFSAREHGINLLFNGSYGEGTLTARLMQQSPLAGLRGLAKRVLSRSKEVLPSPGDAWFHVKLAAHQLASLPAELTASQDHAEANAAKGQFGYLSVVPKALGHPNAFYAGAVRMDFPFRDMRLLRFFASLPVSIVRTFGADRGMARRILAGQLPDAIVSRTRGRPADPDHYARLQRQAPAARKRIPGYRQAGLDAWLDLDWLELELGRIANQGVDGVDHANRTQLTAMAAEYLLWLQDGARSE